MRLLLLLSLLAPLHAKTVELRFPGLAYAIQLSLPENFDPSRKHPAILFYHGSNGRPDTQIIRRETGDKDWIVVGMTYFEQGQLKLAPDNFKKEVTLYHSVRRYLLAKYALDPKRLYISGFSKGGWMSDLLLQQEATLAGGAILGAGHLHKAARPQKTLHHREAHLHRRGAPRWQLSLRSERPPPSSLAGRKSRHGNLVRTCA